MKHGSNLIARVAQDFSWKTAQSEVLQTTQD
jgi:hypothetical protein